MEKTWLCAAKLQLGLAHRTLPGCAPNNVWSARLVNGEVASLGNRRSCTIIIHRTVRWCTRQSGESSATNSSLSGNEKGDVSIIHRTVRCANGRQRQQSATKSAGDTWTAPTVNWCTRLSGVHQTVSGAPTGPQEQWSDAPDLEGDRASDMNSGCPVVHHSTEGRNCLPRLSPTAPSCLGAIKGTLRRMEEKNQAFSKHTKASRLRSHAFDSLC